MGEWGPKSILVGYDGSEGSLMAVDLAATVASKFGAAVVVVMRLQAPIADHPTGHEGHQGDRRGQRDGR